MPASTHRSDAGMLAAADYSRHWLMNLKAGKWDSETDGSWGEMWVNTNRALESYSVHFNSHKARLPEYGA